MCGIGGVFSETLSIEKKREIAQRMAISMHHRGPDASSVFFDENIAMGITRLAIVDRNYKEQFIWNEDRNIVIALNGEIYNHAALRTELQNRHLFETKTDTEVILHLIEELGIDGISRLDGDFAFVIWNTDRKEGILVRDPVGVKPLYYALHNDILVFASEIKPLISCFPELACVDPLAIYDYLTYRYVPGPRTIFKDVMKLKPGACLTFGKQGFRMRQYWEFKRPRERIVFSEEDAVQTGRSLLLKAVLDRLPKEVDYGILLSGGLDSSLITAMITDNVVRKPYTFSIIYDESAYGEISEHRYSRLVAEKFGTIHTELLVTPEMFYQQIHKAIYYLEEPVADPPAVLLSLMCEVAHQSVRVLLSGEGADELHAGYYVYLDMLRAGEAYEGMGRLLPEPDKRNLLSEEFLTSVEENPNFLKNRIPSNHSEVNGFDALHKMLSRDLQYWLPDDLLLKADKMGMMSSVEIRVPYLDPRFIEYSFSVPSEYKIRGNIHKYLLRRIANTFLPQEITHQIKKGFPLPLGDWLRGPLCNWVKEVILSQLPTRGYFDPKALRNFYKEYLEGPPSRFLDHVIWSLVVLEIFHQEIYDRFRR